MIIVAPSILAGSHSNLELSLKTIAQSGAQWVHLDIMDGHFVPNLSFGPELVRSLHETYAGKTIYFDTHLMLDNPQHYIEVFAQAGSHNITIHIEPSLPSESSFNPTYDLEKTIVKIKSMGLQCGLALNPNTPAETILPYVEAVDLVLVMTVQPGFGGQAFRPEMLKKIEKIDLWRKKNNYSFRLQVDGGIDFQTAELCCSYGADTFVAGTSFFKAQDKSLFVKKIIDLK